MEEEGVEGSGESEELQELQDGAATNDEDGEGNSPPGSPRFL